MALVLVQRVFIFQTSHAQDVTLMDSLDLLNAFNWKEGTPIVLADGKQMPSSPCFPLLHLLYLLHGDVKFQCAGSLLKVVMSTLGLCYRLYYLFYILVIDIFGLFIDMRM